MPGTWSIVEIAGKPADVYEPKGPERPRFGILHLHSADRESLRERPAFTDRFDELRLACVCPRGLGSWWSNRTCVEFDAHVTAERHLLDSVVPFFGQRWTFGPRYIGLLGIDMGGQGALR